VADPGHPCVCSIIISCSPARIESEQPLTTRNVTLEEGRETELAPHKLIAHMAEDLFLLHIPLSNDWLN